MDNLKTTTKIVKNILENDKQARNSDSYLYLKVLEQTANQKGIMLHRITVPSFLMYGSEMGFVGFETVRRTRQKVQQHYPELAACEAVAEYRMENEAAVREYARETI